MPRPLALTALLAMALSSAAMAAERPNIIWIVADDLGLGDVGAYGSDIVPTPHIDRLAAGGVRLTDGHVTAPICSPSRAGFHTGRYQNRYGYDYNPTQPRPEAGMLPLDEPTIAERMSAAGYRTGLVGKWHLGMGEARDPLARGFQEAFWWYSPARYIVEAAPGDEIVPLASPGERSKSRALHDGRTPVEDGAYLTDIVSRESVAFIDRHADEDAPFFLVVTHYAPHVPLEATKTYLDRVRHIEDPGQRVQAAMIAALDDGVGDVLGALDAHGITGDTLVVFFSDNGCPRYLDGVCSNAPFSGYKREHLEGGIRVPMIFSWPGTLPAGAVYGRPVISLDIGATSVALAGGETGGDKPLDGVNLLTRLTGEESADPHEHLFWRAGDTFAVRSGAWKLWRVITPAGGPPATFLFNLEEDPSERNNLAAEHPDVVERLAAAFGAWNAGNAPPAFPSRTLTQDINGTDVEVAF
ncbi:MAG: sulfatase-like hydrolase/transferase [Alphaproteobacteria bacterium]|nr:sulfatase-like hydrolase/transferase [Alphaproteobacteria bacterium]